MSEIKQPSNFITPGSLDNLSIAGVSVWLICLTVASINSNIDSFWIRIIAICISVIWSLSLFLKNKKWVMSNVSTTTSKEKSKIFQAILSSPGMGDKCKINLTISRQNILLLSRVIEAGMLSENNPFKDEIIEALPKDSLSEFREIHEEILKKGALTEFYERLKMI